MVGGGGGGGGGVVGGLTQNTWRGFQEISVDTGMKECCCEV